jgi:hypothetical protein
VHVEFFKVVSHEGIDDRYIGAGTWIEDHDDRHWKNGCGAHAMVESTKMCSLPYNSPTSSGFAYIMALI